MSVASGGTRAAALGFEAPLSRTHAGAACLRTPARQRPIAACRPSAKAAKRASGSHASDKALIRCGLVLGAFGQAIGSTSHASDKALTRCGVQRCFVLASP